MLDDNGQVRWGPFGRASAGAVGVDGTVGTVTPAANASAPPPAGQPKMDEYDYLNG